MWSVVPDVQALQPHSPRGEGTFATQASAAQNKEYAHKIETRLALSTPTDNHNQELVLRTKAKLREQRDVAAAEAAAAKELCR
jgi:hypothetical protein